MGMIALEKVEYCRLFPGCEHKPEPRREICEALMEHFYNIPITKSIGFIKRINQKKHGSFRSHCFEWIGDEAPQQCAGVFFIYPFEIESLQG